MEIWPSAAKAGHVYNINARAQQIVENLWTGRKVMYQGMK
jgi:hypothetical protein